MDENVKPDAQGTFKEVPAVTTPEPEDRSMGWKTIKGSDVERWWMGTQWGEAYRAKGE